MEGHAMASPDAPASPPGAAYVPGVCNIGAAEVARRRRGAVAASGLTVALYVLLVGLAAPRPARLVVGLAAAAATVSWLQVIFHFCVAFASRGVYNFGPLEEEMVHVADPGARRADLRRTAMLLAAGAGLGLGVGILAVLVP